MKTYLCLLFCVFYFGLIAQPNLVSNPSFENKVKCLNTKDDNNIDTNNNVKNWFSLLPFWYAETWGGAWGSGRCFYPGCYGGGCGEEVIGGGGILIGVW